MSIEKSNKLIKKNTGNNISVSIKNHFLDFKLIKYMLKAFTALFWFDAIVRYIIWRLGDSMHDDKFSITLFIPFYRLYICLCFSGEFEKARLLSSLTHAYTHFIAPFHFQLGVNGCARVFVRVWRILSRRRNSSHIATVHCTVYIADKGVSIQK